MNQNGGSNIDTLIKLVLVFFISLLSFSVGTFVGKKFSDSQHKISMMNNEMNNESTENKDYFDDELDGELSEKVNVKNKENDSLSEDEINELAKEFISDPNEEIKQNQESTQNQNFSDITKKIVNNKEVVDQKKNQRTPGSFPKLENADIGKYTIQVASYRDEKDAKDQAIELRNQGYLTLYFPGTVKNQTWYRVTIGKFDRRDEAYTYLNKKVKKDHPYAIVRKIVE